MDASAPFRTPLRPLRPAAAAFALLLGGCEWVALARNALGYHTVASGAAANVAVHGGVAYATRAGAGLEVLDAASGSRLALIPPPGGSESVDDVALADGLLFVLDARPPGHLSVFTLDDPARPRLAAAPRAVRVGPFAGVAAAGGVCLVSGGTGRLTLWRYDRTGDLTGPLDSADLGRGQPDVTLAPGGRTAWVATHYRGPRFGIDILRVDDRAGRLERVASLALDGAGFTEGGAKPANFPIEIAVLGADTALVAHARGLAVIGTADPARPLVLARLALGGPAVNVDAAPGRAVVSVAGDEPALVMVDLSGGRPRIARRVALASGTRPLGVALTQNGVIVAAQERGVQVHGW